MEVGREQVQAWGDTIRDAACQCGAGVGGERFDNRSIEGRITLTLAMSTVGLFAATRSSSSRIDAAELSGDALGRLQSAACMRDCVCVSREQSLLFHADVLLLDLSSTHRIDDGHNTQCDRGCDDEFMMSASARFLAEDLDPPEKIQAREGREPTKELSRVARSARFLAEDLERLADRASDLEREHSGRGDAAMARDALAAELARAATGGGITCPLLVGRLIACATVLSGGGMCANAWSTEPLHCAIAHNALGRALQSQRQSMEEIGRRLGGGGGSKQGG